MSIRPCRDDDREAILAIINRAALLRTYWTIPGRQIETSVVLANPPLSVPAMPK